MNLNSKSPKSSTPRLTTDVVPAIYCILSIGQGMRSLTNKIPGSSLPSSDMLLNLLQISTLHIHPSLVLFQVFDLGALQFFEVLFEVFTLYKSTQFLLQFILLSHCRVLIIFTGTQAPIQTLGFPFLLRYPRLYIYPISTSILTLISSYFYLDIQSQSTVVIQLYLEFHSLYYSASCFRLSFSASS